MEQRTSQAKGQGPDGAHRFLSLLYLEPPERDAVQRDDRSFAADLNLDQIIAGVVRGREEPDLLTTLFYRQMRDIDTVRFRHETFRDLEDEALLGQIQHFVGLVREVRAHLDQLEKMPSVFQRQGWFLDAAATYCQAVGGLVEDIASAHISSRGLLAFRGFLSGYATSAEYRSLADDTRNRKEALAQIRYCVHIRGGRVEVSRYDGEPDYSIELLQTFERFKQNAPRDYQVKYREGPVMNQVGSKILDRVARLFSDEFTALDDYCRRHAAFFDELVQRFEREVQFYLAYLEYIAPLRSSGLSFCYPEVTTDSKSIFATGTFDLALARKLDSDGKPVVRNDFHLTGSERVIAVSGPNQGGKSTFARAFGQIHHLASVGCPVPGDSARLFLFDRLFTHFGKEEDVSKMSGKLEGDLLRIRAILEAATGNSILILNEIFSSTTLRDAGFLGTKVMEKIIQLDLLCVYVTFVHELASLSESVVSMVSTIVPDDPAQRTFKIVRAPADGLAYALAIAEKYDLTYQRLRGRLAR
jgi:DNA mismatch repair protein MutS